MMNWFVYMSSSMWRKMLFSKLVLHDFLGIIVFVDTFVCVLDASALAGIL